MQKFGPNTILSITSCRACKTWGGGKVKAKNIVFNSFITNEEAFILQEIANFTGAKLVNSEAKLYKEFLENYSKISGESLYNGSLETIKDSVFIVSIGNFL